MGEGEGAGQGEGPQAVGQLALALMVVVGLIWYESRWGRGYMRLARQLNPLLG